MLERVGPVVAAVLVLAVLVVVFPPRDPEPLVATEPPQPAFLAAYERSRTVEAVVRSSFLRTLADGRELAYEQRLVQRPPDDRLVVGAGSASGRLGGDLVRCNAGEEGTPSCVRGGEAPPYDEEVAGEVADLAALVDADTGAYRLSDLGSGCFELVLRVRVPSPPYGNRTTYCFDADTGVVASLVVERPEAVDRLEALSITTEVTDADLRADDIGTAIATE
jgi:hypothetical protein